MPPYAKRPLQAMGAEPSQRAVHPEPIPGTSEQQSEKVQSDSGINITWDFKGGMRLEDLQESINSILLFNQQPELLIIHCGGNEIGPRSILDIYNHDVCITSSKFSYCGTVLKKRGLLYQIP
ncbi:hypothetical protein DPMN_098289 [Dreissena polymorpha]|uniref:Uncharacterized protein n=1 Tax=Dreissena polymorpha TaxID=45954 RepID=A0A9D4R5I0_DREPO|nr:hypothetical protein DPMN_098289 [Dreissena polymorpha]